MSSGKREKLLERAEEKRKYFLQSPHLPLTKSGRYFIMNIY